MRTWSGRRVPLPRTDTEGDVVDPLDLIVHLGRIARFGHMGDMHWTVLHHSVFVATLYSATYPTDPEGVRESLFHDGHEGFIGADIPAPVKQALGENGRAGLDLLAQFFDGKIRTMARLDAPAREQKFRVKACDLAALLVEADHFGSHGNTTDVEERLARLDNIMKQEVTRVLCANAYTRYIPKTWRTP